MTKFKVHLRTDDISILIIVEAESAYEAVGKAKAKLGKFIIEASEGKVFTTEIEDAERLA